MSDHQETIEDQQTASGSQLSRSSAIAALSTTIDRLEAAWLPTEFVAHPEFFDYQPTPVDLFVHGLIHVQEVSKGPKFLDVGSGIGTKLLIAHQMGFEVQGIEIRAYYAAISRHLCPEATVEIADARGYGKYGLFDVVFCYRPIISEEGQAALERFLTEQMRQDAILFLPFRNVYHLGWRLSDPSVPYVWRRS